MARKPLATYPPEPQRMRAADLEPVVTRRQEWANTPASQTLQPGQFATPAQWRERARRTIKQLRTQYVATDNPMFAWTAYDQARAHGLPVPDWVHDYFRRVFRNLISLPKPEKRQVHRLVSEAVGFVPGGVLFAAWKYDLSGGNPEQMPDRFRRKKAGAFNPLVADKQFDLAYSVYTHRRDGVSPYKATLATASEYDVSQRTVQRAWAKYAAQFPHVRK